MIDPKQKLTRFSQVYSAKLRGQLGAATASLEYRDVKMADALARQNAVHETDAVSLEHAQSQYSISSVEEIIALSRIDEREQTTLVKDAGLSADVVKRLRTTMESLPATKDELTDWARFEQFHYAFGCDLDFNAPPPSDDLAFGAASLGAPSAGAAVPVPSGTPTALPAVNLIDEFMPAIRDQGRRGTCVAFTAAACLEYHLRRFSNLQELDLSEQLAFFFMLTKNGQRNLRAMYPLLVSDGTCRESTWTYYPDEIPGNESQGPAPSDAVREAMAYLCKQTVQLPARSVDAIRQAVYQKRVVGIGVPVYKSWYESAVVRKYGNITVPIPGEVPLPVGHAIALVGYEDNPEYAGGGYFIVRNSWNGYWGTQSVFGPGYGTIPYRYIENFNWDAWCIVN